ALRAGPDRPQLPSRRGEWALPPLPDHRGRRPGGRGATRRVARGGIGANARAGPGAAFSLRGDTGRVGTALGPELPPPLPDAGEPRAGRRADGSIGRLLRDAPDRRSG